MNIINLYAFTDASSYNNGNKIKSEPQHSGSAGIVLFGNTIIQSISTYNPNTSISFGELYAIYLTLHKLYKLVKKSEEDVIVNVLLHSDSAYAVQTLNDWMFKWKKRVDKDGNWIKSDGSRASYQSLIESIDKYRHKDNFNVEIRHISGHIDFNIKKDINKAKERYTRFNKMRVEDSFLNFAVVCNDICDVYAKEVLSEGMWESDHDK